MNILDLQASNDVCDVSPGSHSDYTFILDNLLTNKCIEIDEFDMVVISPLSAIIRMRSATCATRLAFSYVKRPYLYDKNPSNEVHPGFMCELLYVNDHYSEFVKLVSSSDIARDYLDALIAWPGINDEKLNGAKELMRVTLAKNAAIDVLKELGL